MPTGYTYAVCEGKVTEFPAFAMSCARAFGALITMRDDPSDAPIPEEIKPDTQYYDDKIATDAAEIERIEAMSHTEADAAAHADHLAALVRRRDYVARKEDEAARINAMIAKVRLWNPPTPDHVEMKSFMLEQLRISLPGDYVPSIPEALDGMEWRLKRIADLSASIARSRDEVQKEIDRAKGRTEWVKQLRVSLEPAAVL